MSTIWTLPSSIDQFEEDPTHISWFEVDNFSNLTTMNGRGTSTVAPLLHISREPRNDIKMKTWFIRATGFNFQNLPKTLNGVSFKLTMNRVGRISDETIQLNYNGDLIGENQAVATVNPIQVYGGETNTWGVENLNLEMIQDSSFGVTMRFKSHPAWPHKTTPIIISVEMQIH